MAKHIRNLVGLALLLAAVSASAQITRTIAVTVPFPFVAAGKSWPAGDYRVQISTGFLILSSEGITPAIMLSNVDERHGEADPTYLRFRRFGDRRILREVTLDGTAQILNSSQFERELAKRKPSGQKTLVATDLVAH